MELIEVYNESNMTMSLIEKQQLLIGTYIYLCGLFLGMSVSLYYLNKSIEKQYLNNRLKTYKLLKTINKRFDICSNDDLSFENYDNIIYNLKENIEISSSSNSDTSSEYSESGSDSDNDIDNDIDDVSDDGSDVSDDGNDVSDDGNDVSDVSDDGSTDGSTNVCIEGDEKL